MAQNNTTLWDNLFAPPGVVEKTKKNRWHLSSERHPEEGDFKIKKLHQMNLYYAHTVQHVKELSIISIYLSMPNGIS